MPEDGNGSVRITMTDVYRAVLRVQEDITTVKTDLKVHLQLAAHPEAEKQLEDHEQRIRSLTAWKNAIPPAIVIGVSGLIVAVLEALTK